AAERNYAESVRSTRSLLLPLAQLLALFPTLSNLTEPACAPTFAKLTSADSRILSFGIVLPDGTVACGNRPGATARVNLANTPLFERVLETRDFALDVLTDDQVTGKPTIRAGYPIIAADGQLRGVAFAAMDLYAMSDSLVGSSLPKGSFVTLRSRG